MRKLIFVLLAALLLSGLPLAAAEPPAPLTATQIARLESLCRVWGVVKFFHPWIVAPPDDKPVNWDFALIQTIPLVERATSPEEFCAAIDHLLGKLHDPATRALVAKIEPEDVKQPPVEPGLPETKLVEKSGKRVLVVAANDWRPLGADSQKFRGGLFIKAFEEAADTDAIVFDLRRRQTPPLNPENDHDADVVSAALREDMGALLKEMLKLPTGRSRFHCGYPPENAQREWNWAGYYSGFTIAQHPVVFPRRSRSDPTKPSASAGKFLVILTNANTRIFGGLLTALQTSGQAVVLHDSPDLSGLSSYETYSMRLTDGVVATIRTTDMVNADGSVGCVPDIVSAAANTKGEDTLMDRALAIACGEEKPPERPTVRSTAAPVRRGENMYSAMASPNRLYRLLGLFRVWNVIHYFFPYKELMDRSWDSILTEFIPRFADADDPDDYGLLAHELAAQLQDSHVGVSGGPASKAAANRIGAASPFILLIPLRAEMVVAAVDEALKSNVHVGDVVLAVDGEPTAGRIAFMKRYRSASTPHALLYNVRWGLLHGPLDATAKLSLRAPDGTVRYENLPRTLTPDRGASPAEVAAWVRLNVELERKTAVYSALPAGYGYFDLARLSIQQVNAAFEAVKHTPALILDMRGYPKDTMWLIASRLTDKPVKGVATGGYPCWFSGPDQRIIVPSTSVLEPSPLWKFTERIVVLIDGNAMSASETACCLFEEAAKGRITFIGTPTVGANGMVTSTSMPGGITLRFTGYDARHLDGRQLQRVGIQPDIRVEPTIEGIVAGKDEVLEAAIRFLNESKEK
jgi:hypothetical protein